jgi:hypothetical protein
MTTALVKSVSEPRGHRQGLKAPRVATGGIAQVLQEARCSEEQVCDVLELH